MPEPENLPEDVLFVLTARARAGSSRLSNRYYCCRENIVNAIQHVNFNNVTVQVLLDDIFHMLQTRKPYHKNNFQSHLYINSYESFDEFDPLQSCTSIKQSSFFVQVIYNVTRWNINDIFEGIESELKPSCSDAYLIYIKEILVLLKESDIEIPRRILMEWNILYQCLNFTDVGRVHHFATFMHRYLINDALIVFFIQAIVYHLPDDATEYDVNRIMLFFLDDLEKGFNHVLRDVYRNLAGRERRNYSLPQIINQYSITED